MIKQKWVKLTSEVGALYYARVNENTVWGTFYLSQKLIVM